LKGYFAGIIDERVLWIKRWDGFGCHNIIFFSMALQAISGSWPFIQFRKHFYTDGRAPWTSDQLVARPLPTHRTTQTQNKRIQTPNIHALSGIRTHDPSVQASEDSSCVRSRGHCDGHRDIIRKVG
jgi:hypothetical protein